MPREEKFYDLFDAHAEQVVQGSRALADMLAAFNDSGETAEKHCGRVDLAEKTADRITRETLRRLRRSFITPLDREDIHQLITRLDDILDLAHDAAQTITLYDVRRVTPEAIRLGGIVLQCAERVRSAVRLLPSMDNGPRILELCREIDELESEADREMRGAMSRLFREEPDVRELIKQRAIYRLLEMVTDRCEDVANILESIVIENS
jgi:predicted phosphate transport protein (TIGR00153 family)